MVASCDVSDRTFLRVINHDFRPNQRVYSASAKFWKISLLLNARVFNKLTLSREWATCKQTNVTQAFPLGCFHANGLQKARVLRQILFAVNICGTANVRLPHVHCEIFQIEPIIYSPLVIFSVECSKLLIQSETPHYRRLLLSMPMNNWEEHTSNKRKVEIVSSVHSFSDQTKQNNSHI